MRFEFDTFDMLCTCYVCFRLGLEARDEFAKMGASHAGFPAFNFQVPCTEGTAKPVQSEPHFRR